MSEFNATPVTLKCKICGGDIVNDFLVGSCVCTHCGNKWNFEDLIPDYSQYSNIISNIISANEIIENDPDVVSLEQARSLLSFSADECDKIDGVVASDLARVSRDGIDKIDRSQGYMTGIAFFEKQNYQAALEELEKIPGFKNTEELKERCKENVEKDKKAQKMLEVFIGMMVPAMVCIVLKIVADVSIAILIPTFIVASVVLGFLIYRGGMPAAVIELASFICVAPFLIFLIVRYDLHITFFKICKVICIYLIKFIKFIFTESKK